MEAFNELYSVLKKLSESKKYSCDYKVPGLWFVENDGSTDPQFVNPVRFFIDRFEDIIEIGKEANRQPNNKYRPENAVVYNMLVRYSTAYGHYSNNQINDGKINIGTDENGFRETGTFLKATALLPYIKSLGANTIYLLPVTSIGIDGRKGELGSPYAVRHPLKLDENLGEPVLGLDIDTQFKALVEAAHSIGMKVVLEFVFRTASIDSELALEHPEWFYWIDANIKNRANDSEDKNQYGPPVFNDMELSFIRQKIEAGGLTALTAPHKVFRDMFRLPPRKVARVENRIRGVLPDGTEVKLPGAFADWPPDDTQPAWSDVTYLRLYGHKDFNYIAYNTVRMYDRRLATKNNRIDSLWDYIGDVIPYYQKKFGIDGVMIDMGHGLPYELRSQIIRKARKNNPDFIFWEENFLLTNESKTEGYNAALGYMCFIGHKPRKLADFINKLSADGVPLPFLATPETHNTPRAATRIGGLKYSQMAWLLSCLLPGVTFIHSGFELGQQTPVNTGLDFTKEEQSAFPTEELPLFSPASMDWDNKAGFINYIRKIVDIKYKYIDSSADNMERQIVELETNKKNVIAFLRRAQFKGRSLIVAINMNLGNVVEVELELPFGPAGFEVLDGNREYKITGNKLKILLQPYGSLLGIIRHIY